MKKQLIIMIALLATLTLLLSGCGSGEKDLEGKYIATFVLNGGTLDYGASSVNTKVNYAYEPGSYILDPSKIDGYSMYRSEYEFTGWYTSPDCRPEEKWDFSKPFETETLTLYAGWEKAIVFSYTLCYTDGGQETVLGTYKVEAGESFEDWRGYAAGLEDHTPVGFFADADLTQGWDFTVGHPGGETDTDIRVYVKYIPGKWTVVDSFEILKNAMKNSNVYLTADIDCGGEALPFVDYDGIFEGNGHKITNFKAEQKGTARTPVIALFDSLSAKTEIRNVSFEQVTFELMGVKDGATPKAAALAITAESGAKITAVSVQGVCKTNFAGELEKLGDAVFEAESVEITDFTANVTVENQ